MHKEPSLRAHIEIENRGRREEEGEQRKERGGGGGNDNNAREAEAAVAEAVSTVESHRLDGGVPPEPRLRRRGARLYALARLHLRGAGLRANHHGA
ncbi:Os06g0161150 [Oryza sativa Japonica Group]|uniref:Os06g0161150 protein n=1 Tax=Oryza sativa subsp. japonica TaxID=39947 RepID=A0A0P0WT33_ORYSJ|nr:Os06g0161150 [Oryza sativa Japonica Group]